jgi:hypothetical protein
MYVHIAKVVKGKHCTHLDSIMRAASPTYFTLLDPVSNTFCYFEPLLSRELPSAILTVSL